MAQLFKVEIASLHPTQMTLGFTEVERRRRKIAKWGPEKRDAEMRERFFPIVKGPHGRLFITDHHHFGLALLKEGAVQGYGRLEADFSTLDARAFWAEMSARDWVYPYDEDGSRHPYEDIPARLTDLTDNPWRSLSRAVRDEGGWDKDREADVPFVEFMWGDYFRTLFTPRLLELDFEAATDAAVAMARHRKARFLPGWRGEG